MVTALIILLLVLALFGLPLYMVIGGAAMLLGMQMGQAPATFFTQGYGMLADSPTLVSIPLFTFAGYLMAESRTGERLIKLFDAMLGWLPGGLTIQIVVVCSFFTIFTGASGVTIIALGMLLYPVLLKSNYPEEYSLGLLTASGSLGLLLPPSLPLIVYGVIAKTDIHALFWAGVLPGILMMMILGIQGVWVGVHAQSGKRFDIGGFFSAILKATLFLGAVFAVMAGAFTLLPGKLLFGVVAAAILGFFAWSILAPNNAIFARYPLLSALSEAKWEALLPVLVLILLLTRVVGIPDIALLTTAYIFVVEVFVYRDLKLLRDIPRVSFLALKLVGSIILILLSALALSNLLILEQVPDKLFDAIKPIITNKWMFLLALNLFLLLVGCLLDIFSAILVVVPLVVPLALRFGVDPVHLGIIFLANLELGYMTPPVGINLFISSMTFKKPVLTLYRVSLPFLGLLGIALVIITYVPALSLWLPEKTGAIQVSKPSTDPSKPAQKKESLFDILRGTSDGGSGDASDSDEEDQDEDKPRKKPPVGGDGGQGVQDGGSTAPDAPAPDQTGAKAPNEKEKKTQEDSKTQKETKKPPPRRQTEEDDEEP